MRTAKALNGAPHDLVQMFFSTEACHRDGYMEDHLWASAMRTGLNVTRIDIIQIRAEPESFSSPALLSYLLIMKHHLMSELERLGLPKDQINGAHIDIVIAELRPSIIAFAERPADRQVTAFGTLATKNGRTIIGKTHTVGPARPLG